MPSYHCRKPGCPELLPVSGWCKEHAYLGQQQTARRHQHYDKHARNPEAKRFYDLAEWKRTRGQVLATHPICQRCKLTFAAHVHHKIPLADLTDNAAKHDQSNLLALCGPCHNSIEAEAVDNVPAIPFVTGTLAVSEDDTYRLDAAKADDPIRWIEKYGRHYQGRRKGEPFVIEPIQRQILHDVYGYVGRNSGLRRFSHVWWNGPVGCGKSEFLSLIGVYELTAGGEQGDQIYSIASTYKQAKTIFEGAKGFIREHPALDKVCKINDKEIRCKLTGSVWSIVAGISPLAGARPGTIMADECHQWKHVGCYSDLVSRMGKQPQPICWVATNAGENLTGLYGKLQEQASEVLQGKRSDPTLYPIVWAAPPDAPPDRPSTWRAANPMFEVTSSEDRVRTEWERRRGSPADEAEFQRLYCGQHVRDSTKGINSELWTAAVKRAKVTPIDPQGLIGLPLYVGWDGSSGDDNCAAVFIWVGSDRLYVTARFWMLRTAAQRDQLQHGVDYETWAEENHITLMDDKTVGPETYKRIAAEVLEVVKGHTVKAVGYDAYRADALTVELDANKLTCIKVKQGYSLDGGTRELTRLLVEGTINVEPSPVLSWHAANAEYKTDAQGNRWPDKPGAHGSRTKRWQKIDGIAALVTALTEYKVQQLVPAKPQASGGACLIEL